MLCRPKLIATLIYVHKHSYLEGNLTGAACPLSKIKAIAFPTEHMPSQDVGFCLGFQSQTWTLFCGPSIAQTFLSCHLWSGIPRWASCTLEVSEWHHRIFCWVYEVCRSLRTQYCTSTPMITLGVPSPKVRGLPCHAASCPHSMLVSKALALEIPQEKRNPPQ